MTMDQIAIRAQTDKASTGHNYTAVYEKYLEPIRNKPLLVFELGIGGYQYEDRGGQSLKMWYEYLPFARIIGIDCYKKNGLDNDRVTVIHGSQEDSDLMDRLVAQYGPPDLIIDDASHVIKLTIASFKILFKHLKPGGLYFCEDVHTSFWLNDYGGDPDPLTANETTLNFFQKLTSQLSQDTLLTEYRNEYAGYLDFMHFYRNLVIIGKK